MVSRKKTGRERRLEEKREEKTSDCLGAAAEGGPGTHCCSARNPLADLQESFLLIVWDRAEPSNL